LPKPLKIAGIFALLLLIGGYFLWPIRADCLSLADTRAPAAMIRTAALIDPSDPNLCEGLALLSERQIRPAIIALDAAAKAAPETDRWSVQGHLAQALALDRQSEKAVENWDTAIVGAVRAGNIERESLFRGDRGLQLARDGRFTAARADFEFLYNHTGHNGVKAAAAYYAFTASISDESAEAAEKWFPLVLETAEAVGEYTKAAHSTEMYAQLLDKRKEYDASAQAYRAGLAIIEDSGDDFLHAELLEFMGQSRFQAGDYEGGKKYYSQAAQMFREAGRSDYADFLEKNMRATVGRQESGGSCADLLMQQRYGEAIASVDSLPTDRRSFDARVCLIHALHEQGNISRARAELDQLRLVAGGGNDCDTIDAIARRIGSDSGNSVTEACGDRFTVHVDSGGR
jgi:tetratricopeptide (TPR) repeat protein